MQKIFVVTMCFVMVSGAAGAQCLGTGAYQSCRDAGGNSYSISRFGNTTMVQGNGPNGGWSSTSQNLGNGMTVTNGTGVNGQPWNMTQQNLGGGMTSYSGMNAAGQSFHHFCTQFGCN